MSMDEKDLCKALRLCASEESRCVVCEYRHHKGCIAQLQRDAADALERLEATNKTLMRLMRQQAAELERRDRLLKEQEAAIQTALDAAEERRQAAAYASEFQCALAPPRPDGDPHILACVGCGFEHNCRRDGCAVLRKISRIVARAEGGAEDDA